MLKERIPTPLIPISIRQLLLKILQQSLFSSLSRVMQNYTVATNNVIDQTLSMGVSLHVGAAI